MTLTFPFRPVTNKVPPKPKPKPGQRTDGPSLFGKAWAALPVWPAVLLLFALQGCGLFFPRGPYGRIPDLTAPVSQSDSAKKCLRFYPGTHYQQLAKQDSEPAINPKRTDFAPTPAGERRYIRALRAATPRKLKGSGIVYAPANTGSIDNASAVGKNAVAATDSAQIINAPKADNVAGPGAPLEVVNPSRLPWWGWLLIVAAAAYGIRSLAKCFA